MQVLRLLNNTFSSYNSFILLIVTKLPKIIREIPVHLFIIKFTLNTDKSPVYKEIYYMLYFCSLVVFQNQLLLCNTHFDNLNFQSNSIFSTYKFFDLSHFSRKRTNCKFDRHKLFYCKFTGSKSNQSLKVSKKQWIVSKIIGKFNGINPIPFLIAIV